MQIISCEINEKCKKNGEVCFIDFSILGFKRSNDKKKIDVYYLFTDQERDFFIIKESFLLDQNNLDNEMAFLNHPIHETIDMNKYSQFKKDAIKKTMEKCNATNSFYCEFSTEEIINNDIVICTGIQFTLNNIQQVTRFAIPMNIYMKIQIIKNSLIFKLPIDVSIDKNPIYDKIKFHDIKILNYMGSCTINGKGFVNFYSLREENNTTGVFLPVAGDKVLFSKNMDTKKFNSLYKNCFQIDLRNILILDWIVNNEKKQIICIFKKTDIKDDVHFYLLNGNIKESIILNPYKCFE